MISMMKPLQLTRLTELMTVSSGDAGTIIGLIDGPLIAHPDLAETKIIPLSPVEQPHVNGDGFASSHGTFIAGILSARRGSLAPAIAPKCTLLVRPIFGLLNECSQIPSATPDELSRAILDCVAAGAHILNLSVGFAHEEPSLPPTLEYALDRAAAANCILVAAAHSAAGVASPAMHHPWTIPVVACDCRGVPIDSASMGYSVGRRGLRAPGVNVTSLGKTGYARLSGTSVAVPFVTGTGALLRSMFPLVSASEIRIAMLQYAIRRRTSVIPPLLDANGSYQLVTSTTSKIGGVKLGQA